VGSNTAKGQVLAIGVPRSKRYQEAGGAGASLHLARGGEGHEGYRVLVILGML